MNNNHFVISGERRSGSSTLYELLKQHPEIAMLEKSDYDYFIEPELFSLNSISDTQKRDWKSSHSIDDYTSIFKHLDGKMIGYKDADLLWWKPSHERIAEFIPNTKFIFILRNPVKRAESQYFNELRKKREKLTFQEAIEREENGNLTDWEKLHLQYVERGKYLLSLEHFYKYIPKNQVKVVILEELFDKWNETLTDICQFLTINENYVSEIKPLHSNKEQVYIRKNFANLPILKSIFDIWERIIEALIVRSTTNKDKRRIYRTKFQGFYKTSARKKMKIEASTYQKLHEIYKPFNKQLEQLLGKEIPYWSND